MNVFTSMKKMFVACMMLVASMNMMASTVAEVVTAGVQDNASTSGTVVATYSRGFLISDGTGYILTYLGSDSGLAIGDVVTVSGATSMYAGLLQFASGSTFEKTGTAEFTQPEPEVLDGAAMDAYLDAPYIKYVQYTGTLGINGYYYNVTIDGASKAVGSIAYAPEGLVDASLDGKKIIVTGYTIGQNKDMYVNTMGINVVAAEEEGGNEGGNEGGDDVVVTEGNLVENASFEKWEEDKPANWTGVGHNATISKSSDAKSGSYAIEVVGAGGNKRLASQSYTLKAGTYKYSVNVKQTGDAAGMFRLGYIKLTDGAIANTNTDYIYITEAASVSSEWAEASCEFTLNATTDIALVVMNSKNGGGASILVDDVALTTADGGLADGNEEGGEEEKPVSGTVAEIIAAGAQSAATTSGTVVATYARGFLIGDGTGYILTYVGSDSGLAVGDVVTVSGATSMYGGLLQFGNASKFEKTGTAEYTQPEPEVLDAAAMDAYLAAPTIKYVQYTGKLTISGYYYNVAIEGAETAVGSISYPAEGLVNADWNEKVITVTGFLIGCSSSKYVNTMAVSVVEGGTGIDAVDADIAPVYFDITGKQIDAPARGLYIKKVGDKITKEFVR
ncbi:MAG: carbohydrate binding domain-containing protein [Bacteroidaceae bacterium]|nr:carbohydrate binding domain-containing protein [Bacteroidaceae bacterium]